MAAAVAAAVVAVVVVVVSDVDNARARGWVVGGVSLIHGLTSSKSPNFSNSPRTCSGSVRAGSPATESRLVTLRAPAGTPLR